MSLFVRQHPVALAALLSGLAMVGPFTIDAFFPAFAQVAIDLQASSWQMQQTLSVYLLSYGVMSLFHGPLSDAFGRRKIVLLGVIGFIAGSIGCALSNTMGELLFFRVVQGAATGAGMIVGRAIVRDLYDGAPAQRVMSMMSMFFSIAPAVAPIIGGWILWFGEWHDIFWFLVAYGVMMLLLCLRYLPETHPLEKRTSMHPVALFKTYSLIARDWRFDLLALTGGLNFGAFFLYISSAPVFVLQHLRLSEQDFGWFFVPAIAGMLLGAGLSAKLAGKISSQKTVTWAYRVMFAAQAVNLLYSFLVTQPTAPWAVLPVGFYAIGMSMAFPTLSLLMLDRYPVNRGAASSVQAFIWGLMAATVAGFLAASVSDSPRTLAVSASLLTLGGVVTWHWYRRYTPELPASFDDIAEVRPPVV